MKNFLARKYKSTLQKFTKSNYFLIVILFLLALSIRIYGIKWDQGYHLHPDERFLTMVGNDTRMPNSIFQYFDNKSSPLNPYNYPAFQFFVYGTFPLFLTKAVSTLLGMDSYDQLYLVGRFLSALFDSLNIILLYLISRKVITSKNKKSLLIPSLLYATCVLPIQLSHFFTVDTFLNTFILATFTFLIYARLVPAAISFGLALACKVSALYFLPIIFALFIFQYIKAKNKPNYLATSIASVVVSFIVFRSFQPYIFDGIFKINSHFIENIKTLKSFSGPTSSFPPAVQWLSKTPLLFSLQNIILWGLGLPSTILFLISSYKKRISNNYFAYYLSLGWIVLLYLVQGTQFAHNMRYFLPLYAFIFLVIGYHLNTIKPSVFRVLVILHILYGLSFMNIYSLPHSRVQASMWIYSNIAPNSKMTYEEWDDPLPLNIGSSYSSQYLLSGLSLYDPDNSQKWRKLLPIINASNYMILSSNRLWGSIPLVPQRYPQTTKLYRDLFSQKLSFTKILDINNYPGFRIPTLSSCLYFGPKNIPGLSSSWLSSESCQYPGVYLRDDTAEESFTVYDHPKVIIFENKSPQIR